MNPLITYFVILLHATAATLIYSAVGIVLGFPLGLLIAAGSIRRSRLARLPSRLFSSFFRSIPLIVLLLGAYYGLPSIGLNISAVWASVTVLVLVEAAYLSECVRGGFLAMPRGQIEAASIAGLGRWQTARHVILPNVVRLTLPSIVNEATLCVKASSLTSVLGIGELTRASESLAASTYRPLEIYAMAGAIYLVINVASIGLGALAERRLARGFT